MTDLRFLGLGVYAQAATGYVQLGAVDSEIALSVGIQASGIVASYSGWGIAYGGKGFHGGPEDGYGVAVPTGTPLLAAAVFYSPRANQTIVAIGQAEFVDISERGVFLVYEGNVVSEVLNRAADLLKGHGIESDVDYYHDPLSQITTPVATSDLSVAFAGGLRVVPRLVAPKSTRQDNWLLSASISLTNGDFPLVAPQLPDVSLTVDWDGAQTAGLGGSFRAPTSPAKLDKYNPSYVVPSPSRNAAKELLSNQGYQDYLKDYYATAAPRRPRRPPGRSD